MDSMFLLNTLGDRTRLSGLEVVRSEASLFRLGNQTDLRCKTRSVGLPNPLRCGVNATPQEITVAEAIRAGALPSEWLTVLPRVKRIITMISMNKLALIGLIATGLAGFASLPASAQELCINAPVMSLTDQTTDNAEAQQRIESLGNRCVRSQATGRRITQGDVTQFLETDPDSRDIDYSNLVELDN
jgi:hypothetical protein